MENENIFTRFRLFQKITIVVLVLFTTACQPRPNTEVENLVFAGIATNSQSGDWPNNRLVIVFLNGKELGRGVTAIGEFPETDFGKTDGLFIIIIPNTYGLTLEALRTGENSKLEFDSFQRIYFFKRDTYIYHWIDSVEEGGTYHLRIPSKNLDYIVKVFVGDVSTLPPEIQQPGSAELLPDETMILAGSNAEIPSANALETDTKLQEITRDKANIETVDINNFSIPLDNCGGSGPVVQKYVKKQTFIHEYEIEAAGGALGIWGTIAYDIEGAFGYKQGQIDEVEIEFEVTALSGTNQIYIITWQEVWEPAVAKVTSEGESIELPFKVKTNLIYRTESKSLPCP